MAQERHLGSAHADGWRGPSGRYGSGSKGGYTLDVVGLGIAVVPMLAIFESGGSHRVVGGAVQIFGTAVDVGGIRTSAVPSCRYGSAFFLHICIHKKSEGRAGSIMVTVINGRRRS
jgi:hypothetical protein